MRLGKHLSIRRFGGRFSEEIISFVWSICRESAFEKLNSVWIVACGRYCRLRLPKMRLLYDFDALRHEVNSEDNRRMSSDRFQQFEYQFTQQLPHLGLQFALGMARAGAAVSY